MMSGAIFISDDLVFVLKFVRWMLQMILHQSFSCSCSAITDLLSHKPECEWKHELNTDMNMKRGANKNIDMNMNTDAENNTDTLLSRVSSRTPCQNDGTVN